LDLKSRFEKPDELKREIVFPALFSTSSVLLPLVEFLATLKVVYEAGKLESVRNHITPRNDIGGETITVPFLATIYPIIPNKVSERFLVWEKTNFLWSDLRYHGSSGTGASSLPVLLPTYVSSVFVNQDENADDMELAYYLVKIFKDKVIQSLFYVAGYSLFLATVPDYEIELADHTWWQLLFDTKPIERPIGYGTCLCIDFSLYHILDKPLKKMHTITYKLKTDKNYRMQLLIEMQSLRSNGY
jgi:hypothetical protein